MKKGLMLVVIVCLAVMPGCKKSSPVPDTRVWHEVKQEKIIDYQLLRNWVPGKSGTGLEILVSPESTKEEVLALARELVFKYKSQGQIIAMIFDSKEAWENRWNDKYPEEKFYKHKLVSITVPVMEPIQTKEIVWTAEKRDEPKAKR